MSRGTVLQKKIQYTITGIVTLRIVYIFEVVQVKEECGTAGAVPGCTFYCPLQFFHQCSSIE